MKEEIKQVNVQVRKLEPSKNMHLKNIKNNDIYEGTIYLGAYDSAENYMEVSEEEYQEYLKKEV